MPSGFWKDANSVKNWRLDEQTDYGHQVFRNAHLNLRLSWAKQNILIYKLDYRNKKPIHLSTNLTYCSMGSILIFFLNSYYDIQKFILTHSYEIKEEYRTVAIKTEKLDWSSIVFHLRNAILFQHFSFHVFSTTSEKPSWNWGLWNIKMFHKIYEMHMLRGSAYCNCVHDLLRYRLHSYPFYGTSIGCYWNKGHTTLYHPL